MSARFRGPFERPWRAPWGWTREAFVRHTYDECLWFTSQPTYADGQVTAWCTFVLLITTAAMATLHGDVPRSTQNGGAR